MANRFWIPTLMAAALLLSACGESEEASNSVSEDDATVSETAEQDSAAVSNNEEADESSEPSAPVEQSTQPEPSTQAQQEEEASEEAQTRAAEDVPVDEDTLSADPSEALEEEGGLPGEVTSTDVEDVIAETERRFEEAQQRLDEQFKEVENRTETLAPDALDLDELEEDVSADWEAEMDLPDSSLPDSIQQEGELGEDDVQAMIEETERRFEEAQQRLDEQFQELEEKSTATQEMMEDNSANTAAESESP
jgi:hypothetical protein